MSDLNCSWPLDVTECCKPVSEDDGEVIERAIAKASTMMTRLSGYRIGQCSAAIRPLAACRECRTSCCGGADGVRLSGPDGRPVTEVTKVRIGPTEIPSTGWRFENKTQTLWRVPPDKWPKQDEVWSQDGSGEAFVVDIIMGAEPDEWAIDVATELACELVKSCKNQPCRIPKNAVNINAQGVNVLLDDQDLKTIIPAVGGWVEAVNPYNAVLPGRLFSADLKKAPNKVRGGCCGAARY